MKDESIVIIGVILLAIGIIFLLYNGVRYLAGWTGLPKFSTGVGVAFFVVGMLLTNKRTLSAKKRR